MGEIGAAIAHLRGLKEVRADRIGITGFCMGGRVTFLSAARHAADLKAAVAFYGGGIAADAPNAPINFADKIRCPVLCFFGETDQMIPLDQVRKVEDTLKRLGAALLPRRVRQGRLGEDPGVVPEAFEIIGENPLFDSGPLMG